MAGAFGNQYVARSRLFTEAIYQALDRRGAAGGRSRLEVLTDFAEKLLAEADNGEPWALMELANRLEGKPQQRVELTGEDGGPVQLDTTDSLEIVRRLALLLEVGARLHAGQTLPAELLPKLEDKV